MIKCNMCGDTGEVMIPQTSTGGGSLAECWCQSQPLLKLEAPPLLSKDEIIVFLQDELLIDDMPGLRKLSNDDLWTLLQAVRGAKNAKT